MDKQPSFFGELDKAEPSMVPRIIGGVVAGATAYGIDRLAQSTFDSNMTSNVKYIITATTVSLSTVFGSYIVSEYQSSKNTKDAGNTKKTVVPH